MSQVINPNLFLFQQLTIQTLEFIKKNTKKTKLEDMDITAFVNQARSANLNKYTEMLAFGLAYPKTRIVLFQYYDKIYKQNLAENRTMPDGLIATFLQSQAESAPALGRLLTTLLTHHSLFLTNSQRSRCLKYILQGTRNKAVSKQFSLLLSDSLQYLSSHNHPPINSFLVHFVNHLANQVQLHQASNMEYSLQLHPHDSVGKYGKCFMCGAPAGNYDKEMLLPLCGFDCKGSLTELRVKINRSEIFDLFSWLIEQSVYGDEVVFRQIGRELRNQGVGDRVTEKDLRVLLPELLKNAQQGSPTMVAECHRIFVSIFESYRVHFRNQLKAYLKEMARQLQAEKEIAGKISLLKLFSELFRNAQNINAIYANYDCRFYETNLLEQQMGLIGRLSIALDEDQSVRRQAKFCIVQLLKGQLEYLKRRPVSMTDIPIEAGVEFLKQKKVKAHIQKAIKQFNNKPSAGIRYLRENYFEDQAMTVVDVAKFIRQNEEMEVRGTQPKLKKQKMGEYFGSPSPQAAEVYKAYLDLLSFEKMPIDDALRELLNHFILPKQNQQITRVIQGFCNKSYPYSNLKSQNGFFQLVYAIIMLQTSLHNPNVRANQKLKLTDFLSICSNIDGGVDKSFIQKLYYSVSEKPLSVRPQFSSEYLLSKAYLNPYDQDKYVQTSSSLAGLVSLLEYIWQYVYVALVDRGNLDGLYEAVLVYGSCDMEEAEGFVEALVKLARNGNVEAHDDILRLAAYDNGTLGKCWSQIFDFMFEMEENQATSNSRFDTSVVDQILGASAGLSFPKFIEFMQQFCTFATSNTKDGKYTRQLFVLRHIIEIVEYNLPRLKSLWGFLWPLLNDFYVKLCLHPRTNISVSAIDSLKQLSLKLMRIPQDEVIQQSTFLSPFLYVYQRSGTAMKDLIVNIIGMLICKEMATGWQIIYSILEKADENQAVIKVVDRIMTVGLGTVLHPTKLHRILVKQLVTINDSHKLTPKLLSLLTSVCTHLNNPQTTFQTLKALLQKYQISQHPDLLRCFFDMIEATEHQHRTPRVFELIVQLINFTNRVKDYARSSLVNSYVNLANQGFLMENFDRLRDIWVVNMESVNRRAILPMFYEGVVDGIRGYGEQHVDKVVELLIGKHQETLPKELLMLANLDPDFERVLKELPVAPSSKADLIELSLERDFYEYKFLKILCLLAKANKLKEYHIEKIRTAAKESYENIIQFNQRVLLRYFLWKNGFMSAHGQLPGLLKQGLQASQLLIQVLTTQLKQFTCRLLTDYNLHLQLRRKIQTMQSTQLKPIYKQQIDRYLSCYKSILIKAFSKLAAMGCKDPTEKATDLYLLILEVMQKTTDKQLIGGAKPVLRMLLKRQIDFHQDRKPENGVKVA